MFKSKEIVNTLNSRRNNTAISGTIQEHDNLPLHIKRGEGKAKRSAEQSWQGNTISSPSSNADVSPDRQK
jgi:hypothetical protein